MSPNQVFRLLAVTPARILLAAAILWAPAVLPQEAAYRERLRVAVERIRYDANADVSNDANGIMAGPLVAEFYERRSFLPAWRDDAPRIDSLLALIEDSFADGLDPADYHQHSIEARHRPLRDGREMSPAEWAAFELTLTDALISLIHHQRFGKADPLAQHTSWNFREGTGEPDSLHVAEEAMNAASLKEFVHTPARQLFSTAERAFGHGCIRVENPLELAEILLGANGWDRKRIDAAVASRKTTTVYLAEPMSILLIYWTANVDPDGVVHFYRDIYQRDPPIASALDGPFRIGE